ncbi:hypothetical protein D3C75_651050 [compost metagenome]
MVCGDTFIQGQICSEGSIQYDVVQIHIAGVGCIELVRDRVAAGIQRHILCFRSPGAPVGRRRERDLLQLGVVDVQA